VSRRRSSQPKRATDTPHREEDDATAIFPGGERVPEARSFDLCADRAAASGSDDELSPTIERADDDSRSRDAHGEIALGVDELCPAWERESSFFGARATVEQVNGAARLEQQLLSRERDGTDALTRNLEASYEHAVRTEERDRAVALEDRRDSTVCG
jgi:hypothetical protein